MLFYMVHKQAFLIFVVHLRSFSALFFILTLTTRLNFIGKNAIKLYIFQYLDRVIIFLAQHLLTVYSYSYFRSSHVKSHDC